MQNAPASLDLGRQLMAFNWLTAGYAHADWLGPWSELLEPRHKASARLLRRVSMVLLSRYDLRERYLRETSTFVWLLKSNAVLSHVADELGTAMLGGWVQRRLERDQVAAQIKVLGVERRAQALGRAQTLRALPFAASRTGWPIEPRGPQVVGRLGLSCLAAMLNEPNSGARERFAFRFAAGTLVPLELSNAQYDEAFSLVHASLNMSGGT